VLLGYCVSSSDDFVFERFYVFRALRSVEINDERVHLYLGLLRNMGSGQQASEEEKGEQRGYFADPSDDQKAVPGGARSSNPRSLLHTFHARLEAISGYGEE